MSSPTLKDIYNAINELRDEVRTTYVTKDEFTPVKMIVFGLVTMVLATVLGYILTSVVKAQ